jgi:hypothetical protein
MEKADWYSLLMKFCDWNTRYLIEMNWESGKVPFGIYSVLTDKESVMQLLCALNKYRLRREVLAPPTRELEMTNEC